MPVHCKRAEVGQVIGFWTILEDRGHGNALAQCACGKQRLKKIGDLLRRQDKRCNFCTPKMNRRKPSRLRVLDFQLGVNYSNWYVLPDQDLPPKLNQRVIVKCRCRCGVEGNKCISSLLSGQSRQCRECAYRCVGEKNKTRDYGMRPDAPIVRMFGSYKTQALKRGKEFLLTYQDFYNLVSMDCAYCGRKPFRKQKAGESTRTKADTRMILCNGVDRVDNDLPYVLENCVSCCQTCNVAKKQHDSG